ncbi:hypothetical protein [Belnapia sp. F-4-1]|uniref:hypothetical protein n=1 Tax=Belnapia sp. F-4-1 TaxID=1545443 RepID=UPI0005BD5921|nr:hypothetical protein [Belnapia sp. F-4-1]
MAEIVPMPLPRSRKDRGLALLKGEYATFRPSKAYAAALEEFATHYYRRSRLPCGWRKQRLSLTRKAAPIFWTPSGMIRSSAA